MTVSKLESLVLGVVVLETLTCQKRIGSVAVLEAPAFPSFMRAPTDYLQPDNRPDQSRHIQADLEYAGIRAGRLEGLLGALTTRSSVTTAWQAALTAPAASGSAWPGGKAVGEGRIGYGRSERSAATTPNTGYQPKRLARLGTVAVRPCQARTGPGAGTFSASTRGERSRCGG
jgi:hypothetical protein